MLTLFGLLCLCVAVLVLASQSIVTPVGKILLVLGVAAMLLILVGTLRTHGFG